MDIGEEKVNIVLLCSGDIILVENTKKIHWENYHK
jgi:hypothetical protein